MELCDDVELSQGSVDTILSPPELPSFSAVGSSSSPVFPVASGVLASTGHLGPSSGRSLEAPATLPALFSDVIRAPVSARSSFGATMEPGPSTPSLHTTTAPLSARQQPPHTLPPPSPAALPAPASTGYRHMFATSHVAGRRSGKRRRGSVVPPTATATATKRARRRNVSPAATFFPPHGPTPTRGFGSPHGPTPTRGFGRTMPRHVGVRCGAEAAVGGRARAAGSRRAGKQCGAGAGTGSCEPGEGGEGGNPCHQPSAAWHRCQRLPGNPWQPLRLPEPAAVCVRVRSLNGRKLDFEVPGTDATVETLIMSIEEVRCCIVVRGAWCKCCCCCCTRHVLTPSCAGMDGRVHHSASVAPDLASDLC